MSVLCKGESRNINNNVYDTDKNKLVISLVTPKKAGFESLIYTFHFAYNESDFVDNQPPNFDYLVKLLNQHPKNQVSIEAHTDNMGNVDYNLWLSQNRAERIMVYLENHGIHKKRIKAVGYGEQQPIADNFLPGNVDNPFGRAKNRRAVIKLIKAN